MIITQFQTPTPNPLTFPQLKAGSEAFWDALGERIQWKRKWTQTRQTRFEKPVSIEWYLGGELNVTESCLDRHLAIRGDQAALVWIGDSPSTPTRTLTYRELHHEVCRWAAVLEAQGVRAGDTVTIYLPMIPEAAIAMLACARIGAPHSVVFGGFSPDSLSSRILDSKSKFVITADAGFRGGKTVPLKQNVDVALKSCPDVTRVLTVKHAGAPTSMLAGRDLWIEEALREITSDQIVRQKTAPRAFSSEHPLFLLYTSGSTGKPKGLLHTSGGYLAWASYTHALVFDAKPGARYWCTADVGWVTGHSYVVYGPLANGVTSYIFEGVPNYPSPSRHWEIIDEHQIEIYYTAPTAIRALMREGEAPLRSTSRKSLRVMGSVGEPINPEAWLWYFREVGGERAPIVDTWWQTETGGILISPIPFQTALKPGSATRPLPGIYPLLVDEKGATLPSAGDVSGNLCIADSWPGQARTIYGDHNRFEETYFSAYPGLYFTGDGCHRDQDGDYWITGRVDDVLNVAGHRLGTAEIESACVEHHAVAEAAVVGRPHDIKGQGIYAYISLKSGITPSDQLAREIVEMVRDKLSPIAKPDWIQWAPRLPKTRSGKIMRRILRKVAEGDVSNLGDTSTLAEPDVVEELKRNRAKE